MFLNKGLRHVQYSTPVLVSLKYTLCLLVSLKDTVRLHLFLKKIRVPAPALFLCMKPVMSACTCFPIRRCLPAPTCTPSKIMYSGRTTQTFVYLHIAFSIWYPHCTAVFWTILVKLKGQFSSCEMLLLGELGKGISRCLL